MSTQIYTNTNTHVHSSMQTSFVCYINNCAIHSMKKKKKEKEKPSIFIIE